jgi:long-chain fatty acid transport protein
MRRTGTVLIALGSLLAVPTGAVYGTDGHFLHGVGAVNAAMGGAGVAAPASMLGAFYLNPAALMAFDGTRIEFGFEMFKPDRSVTSSAGPGAAGTTTSRSNWTPIPAMGWTAKLNNERVVLGVGLLGIGGFGVDYPTSMENPVLAPQQYRGFGQIYSNYQLMKISPAIAVALTDKLWFGAAANLDWASLAVDPMPIAAPAADPGPDGIPFTADDRAFYSGASSADGALGVGFQAGLVFNVNDMIALGASVTSPQYFQDFEFNSTYDNPNLPNFGEPRTVRFNLDMPMMLAGGLSLRPLPTLQLAGDLRYFFYEQTDGFELPDNGAIFNQDGSVNGFGWENIYSLHLGAELDVVEQVAFRGGYNYTQNPVPDELSMINVPAPAIVKHHLSVGLGIKPSRRFEISAAYYHAFQNDCGGELLTPAGAIPGTSVINSLSENSLLVQFSFATRGSI